jgi:SAM-dependent methyltransferase
MRSKPENCEFVVADAEDPWEFSHKFDFIHLNDLFMCFEDQKDIFRKSFEALAPGGYTQILDPKLPLKSIDDTLDNTSLQKWFKACVKAGEMAGRPWLNVAHYKEWMEDIGFEDVTEVIYHIPINDWPLGSKEKEIGMMLRKDLSTSLSSLKSILTHGLKWNDADVEELLKGAKHDLRNRNIHAYLPL